MSDKIHNKRFFKTARAELRNNPTPEEVLFWNKVKNFQLGYKFRRQHSIGNYIVDFYCAEKKIIVELDGVQHLENTEYDNERSFYLNSMGYEVKRFWNEEIRNNIDQVISEVKRCLENK
jgi:very-short-patch-repair endonuclease